MRRAFIFSVLMFFNVGFADSLVVTKNGFSTYSQRAEFILPEGESVVGPIKLLPYAKVDSILIKPQASDVSVVGYVLEQGKEKNIEAIIGKNISIEGDGRVITGTVVSVKDGYITLDTKKGMVMTTLPAFPSRISSPLNWQDSMSPKITIKLKSTKPKNSILNVIYPVDGINYQVYYIGSIDKNQLTVQEFYRINNSTSLSLKDIELYIKDGDKVVKLYEKTYIEPFSSKVINTKNYRLDISGKTVKVPLNNITISIYKDGVFVGDIKVVNNTVNIP